MEKYFICFRSNFLLRRTCSASPSPCAACCGVHHITVPSYRRTTPPPDRLCSPASILFCGELLFRGSCLQPFALRPELRPCSVHTCRTGSGNMRRVSFSTPSTYRNRLSILSPFVHLLSFYPTAPAFSDLLSRRLLPAAAFWFYDLHVYRYQIAELLPVFVEQPAATIRFPQQLPRCVI